MAEQVGKFLTELPELETPTDDDAMYIVDGSTASKKITMANLKRVLGGNVTGTVEGALVSFSDGADGIPMEECEVTLVPSQDLHGYSKPWAGGAGKNKYIGSPSFDNYVSKETYQINSETYNGHEVIYKSTAWSGAYASNIDLEAGVTYTFSAMVKMSTTSSIRVFMGNDTTLLSTNVGTDWERVTVQISPTTNITNARIRIESVTNGVTIYLSEFQLEINSQATTYEPYSNICPISGHTDVTVTVASTSGGSGEDTTVSLGRTVYGGSLDVTTGELKITHGITTLNGTETFISINSGMCYGTMISEAKRMTDIEGQADALSNYFENHINAPDIRSGAVDHCFNVASQYLSGYTVFRNSTWANLTEVTTWFSNNNTQVYYELATPQTFNLTPTQVETLLGQNYVSHDGGGNIKVVYIRDLDIVINDLINRVTALENE